MDVCLVMDDGLAVLSVLCVLGEINLKVLHVFSLPYRNLALLPLCSR